jgi:hypothetical protein
MAETVRPKSIAVHGHGDSFAERAEDARAYFGKGGLSITAAVLACPASAILDVDAPLREQPAPIQQLVQPFRQGLETVFGYEPGEVSTSELTGIADGWHLLRAIEGQLDGWGVGEGSEFDRPFPPSVMVSPAVRDLLIAAGIQAIRFHDREAGPDDPIAGPFYLVLDRAVIQEAARGASAHAGAWRVIDDRARTAEREALNREWLDLDDEARAAVRAVVGEVRICGMPERRPFRDGEVYAGRHPAGGISWGLDGVRTNVWRGVQRLPQDEQPALPTPAAFAALASFWEQFADPAAVMGEPGAAKELLAAVDAHSQAADRWSQRERPFVGADSATVTVSLEVIGGKRELIHAAVRAGRANPAWRQAFDAHGWSEARRLSVTQTIADLLTGRIGQAAAAAEPPEPIRQHGAKRGGR